MKILNEPPPIYADICRVFDVGKHQPCFSWGSTIFNPFKHDLLATPEIIAHEEMHGFRQCGSKNTLETIVDDDAKIRLWWKDYLESASFRLEEEIPAHRAEYRHLLRLHGNTRPNRRRFLVSVAKRLRNPLYEYNHIFSFEQAKAWIELDETEFRG